VSKERLKPSAASVLAFVIMLCCAVACFAQFETASVLGSVKDSSGAVMTGASVSLINLQTGIKDTVKTNAEGNYQFLTVKIGRYQVRVEAEGFRVATSEPFDVLTNARQRVDMSLRVGATTESITVTGAVKLLETDSSDRGHVVRADQIVNLPLNGRAYADLALLAPGVRKSTITNRDASFNVNGQRMALNNFTIDGLDNNSYATSNQGYSNQVVQASPDALAEFKVQTNNYSAEYGRASGATINASIRSGTNRLHGSAWEFIRNTDLNAVGFFKPTTGKPTLTQNQFGFTIGGPVFKDRTFFFADYEGFRSVAHALSWQTLPTEEMRNGIFPVPIKNPYTGEVYPDGRIPQSLITDFAKKVLEGTPLPNLPGVSNNYKWTPRSQAYNDKGDVKIDHRFNDKWNAFVRLSQRKVNNYEPPSFPGASAKGGNAHVRTLNQHLAIAANYVMDPRTLFEFRMGVSRSQGGKSPDGVGDLGMAEIYGYTGIPKDPRYYGGLFTINVSGYPGFGRQSSNPQFQNPLVFNPKVNASRFFGPHTVKFGYEYQNIRTEVDDFNPKYGVVNFGGQFSKPSGGTGGTYIYGLADFLFGARDWYELSAPTVANLRQKMHFFYVQDDWKVSPRLTLNLGARYEFATPQYERDNRQSNFDPNGMTLILAKDGSLYDRTGVHPDRNNFAPRVGLAYTVDSKTVVRSGYGVSYVHFNRLGAENLLAENYPFFFSVRITQQPSQGICASASSEIGTCFRPIWQGHPEGLADASRVPLANQGWNYYIPPDIRTGYVQSWHFTIQRQIARDLMLDLAYVGSRSVKLVVLGDANQARVNQPGENTPLQQRRPYTGLQNIEESIPAGSGSYNGLQVKVERKFNSGFYLLNSFTWSKAIDNAAGHLEVGQGDNSRVNFYDLKSEKGISNYNQPFNNTTTVIWDVPYGKGRAFGKSAPLIVNAILGGWRMTGINTMTSGLPFTLRYSAPSNFQVSGMPSYRPNVIGPILAPESERTYLNYLSKTNVVAPTDSRYPFGSASRNMTRGYAYYNLDLGLHKQFALPGEDRRFEVRGEFFNFLNRTNFTVPDYTLGSASYGRISSTYPARIVQIGLKLYL
jgi:hypothetical protein